MVSTAQRPKLLAIVGPTASGKSELAMRLATKYNGEIIAADSRTIYRGMDIGTAKPTKTDRAKMLHWGLDLVEPGQRFTAYQFKNYALTKIADIQKRGKLPILVGGTGLYIDAVLYNFNFPKDADPQLRKELEGLSVEELQQIIQERGYKVPENSQNKRYLVRAIEIAGQKGSRSHHLLPGTIIIGLLPSDEALKNRISARAEAIFKQGIVSETEQLMNKYSADVFEPAAGIAYRICLQLIKDKIDEEQALNLLKTADWQYARRQKTWFKRNPDIKWFDDIQQAEQGVRSNLEQLN